jgi:hypothetical protein
VLHCLFSTPQTLTGEHSANDNLTFDWQNYEMSRPDITGQISQATSVHSSILKFIEESPELGYHQLGKLLQACYVVMPSNDGKSCSYGNGKKNPTLHMLVDKGCSLDTYFCATDLRNWN